MKNVDHPNQTEVPLPADTAQNVWSSFTKPDTECEHSAYLFWKLQSQLTKLNSRLNKVQRSDKPEE